jgi:hypothetical protein
MLPRAPRHKRKDGKVRSQACENFKWHVLKWKNNESRKQTPFCATRRRAYNICPRHSANVWTFEGTSANIITTIKSRRMGRARCTLISVAPLVLCCASVSLQSRFNLHIFWREEAVNSSLIARFLPLIILALETERAPTSHELALSLVFLHDRLLWQESKPRKRRTGARAARITLAAVAFVAHGRFTD